MSCSTRTIFLFIGTKSFQVFFPPFFCYCLFLFFFPHSFLSPFFSFLQEGAQFPLNTKSVIEVWNAPPSEVAKVVKAGYRALYASSWYLDQQIPNPNETFYLWGDTWKDFYMADPVAGQSLTPAELELVLGGEACMWGEQVDYTDFDIRVWPRAAAVAERLWSPKSYTDIDEAEPRLGAQRCRMVQRGINAFPIYPDFCDTGVNGPMPLPLPLSLQQLQKIIL
jgi:hypothetical protein